MKYKLIIFDLDGTLINSIDGISYSMNKILKDNGFPIHSNEVYKSFVGNGRKELVKKSLPLNITNSLIIDKFSEQMENNYIKYWDYKMSPYIGIIELLNLLHNKKILLNINTNKDSESSKLIIDKYFPQIKFNNIIGNSSLYKRKPDPEGVNYIINKTNIEKKDCVYIGDSEVDINTAENANIDSILVTWGYRNKQELKNNGAKILVNNTEELINSLI